jgi:hypothetical protein
LQGSRDPFFFFPQTPAKQTIVLRKLRKQQLTMLAQAPTPRTTRNSRGFRESPGVSSTDSCLEDSVRVSRRRRIRGTPTTTNL